MKNFNKLFFKLLMVISFLLSNKELLLSQVQPLFYNGDFENYSTCPSNFGQINFVNGLTSCNITPDYFNLCGFKATACRTIMPYSGNGCIGMFGGTWNATSTQYETTVAVLDNPTVNGAQYDINFYLFGENKPFAPCYYPPPTSCFSFGFYFFKSSNPPACVGFPIPASTSLTPHVSVNGSSIITGSWNNYSLLYTANDVYDRVLFGWFPNASAYTSACYNSGSTGSAYVFMDKLCMDVPGNNCNICSYSIDATTTTNTVCSGSAIALSGTKGGGVISTTWSTTGDGTFNNPSSLVTSYTPGTADISAGTVSLTLATDDPAGSCTSKSDMVVVSISNKSNATINSAGPFCVSSSSLNLSAAQSGGVWSGPGIANATTGAFSPTTAGAGNHTITYMINGACGDTSTTNIQVIAGANATINSAGPFCANSSSLNLSAVQSGGVWSGSGIINTTTGAFSPTTAGVGNHTITYMINSMCGDTSTVTIQVVSKGNATINSAGPFCVNNSTLNLSAAQSGGVWSGAGIINATTGVFSPNMAGAGVHTITYMINSSCGDTATTSIEVIPNANTTINSAGPFCVSSSTLNLSAAQAGGAWSGTGITNTSNGVFSPNIAGAGNHVITYSISGSCGGSSTTTVQVIANANASINSAGPFCVSSSSLNLSAAPSGGVWSGTGITNTSNGVFSPNIAGIGNHIITYMINGACGDTSTTNIQVIADANATINSAGPFCVSSSSLNLSAAQLGGVWSGPGIINSINGTFDPLTAGVGTWNVMYSIGGNCGSSDTLLIQVNKQDTASFSYNETSFCIPSPDPMPIISGTSGGVFTINNSGVIDAATGKLFLETSGAGSYLITYSTMGTCPDQSSVLVTICDNSTLLIPNVFSPNKDDVNDFFQIKGNNIKSLKVAIFNRWGDEVYSWEGLEGSWDGKTTSGNDANEGTYFYVVTIVDKKDSTSTKNGFLTLFR